MKFYILTRAILFIICAKFHELVFSGSHGIGPCRSAGRRSVGRSDGQNVEIYRIISLNLFKFGRIRFNLSLVRSSSVEFRSSSVQFQSSLVEFG